MSETTESSGDFLDRIVIYLQAPTANGPARMGVYTSCDKKTPVLFENFTHIQPLLPADQIGFNVQALAGIIQLDWLAIGCKPDCRVMPAVSLGLSNDGASAARGVEYDDDEASEPCRALVFTFYGSGVLVARDTEGVEISVDLSKDERHGLCLTLSANDASSVRVKFAGDFLPLQEIIHK